MIGLRAVNGVVGKRDSGFEVVGRGIRGGGYGTVQDGEEEGADVGFWMDGWRKRGGAWG